MSLSRGRNFTGGIQERVNELLKEYAGLDDHKVSVCFTGLSGYPSEVPFDPPEKYPECPLPGVSANNRVYAGVRQTLHQLGLDRENYGTPNWNPLGSIVKPGMTVLIKPNAVRHYHITGGEIFSMITHASVVRPMLDYVCKALKNQGTIIVGDSPAMAGVFEKAFALAKIQQLLEWYQEQTSIPIEWFDLRESRAVRTWLYGNWGRKVVRCDPRGFRTINLGEESKFEAMDASKLRVSVGSPKDMLKHHGPGRHEYIFPNPVLESDAIISIPKMKTHRRTGVSLALKNFMGLPAAKYSVPHYRLGSLEEGGDQYLYPSWRKRAVTALHDQITSDAMVPVKFAYAVLKRFLWWSHWLVRYPDILDEGKWYGNDTLWRSLLDINRIAFFADKNGKICKTQQRRYFCLVDGIVAGEKKGPSAPDPVKPGVLIGGQNPIALDVVACGLMGFDVDRIPIVKKGLEESHRPNALFRGAREAIEVSHNKGTSSLGEFLKFHNLKFKPHPNWKGHVERTR